MYVYFLTQLLIVVLYMLLFIPIFTDFVEVFCDTLVLQRASSCSTRSPDAKRKR